MARAPKVLPPDVLAELPQRLLDGAEAFFFAGIICSSDFDATRLESSDYRPLPDTAADMLASSNKRHSLGAPPIVNLALSVELYLKLILYVSGTTSFTDHSHRLLFDQINKSYPATADKIVAAHRYARGDRAEFDEYLDEISDAFTKWRYAHEQSFLIMSASSIFDMAQALRNVAKELTPHQTWIFADRSKF